MNLHEAMRTILPWVFIGMGACGLVFFAVLLWRWRQQDRHWQHESRVQQRIAELLQQEYVNLLTPEERQRREAQRQHLQQLRTQAEAELAAEQLWMACRDKEEYESGKAYWYDCSADCYHFHEVRGGVGRDWDVCTDPKSPRVGLLTFEHMGCEFYESSYRQMGQNHSYQREERARQSRKRR